MMIETRTPTTDPEEAFRGFLADYHLTTLPISENTMRAMRLAFRAGWYRHERLIHALSDEILREQEAPETNNSALIRLLGRTDVQTHRR